MRSPPDVLVAGSLSIDSTEGRPGSALGGVVTYASLTFLQHGLGATAAFRVAGSELWAAQRLTSLGMRTVYRESAYTTRFVQRIDRDLREQWMPASAAPIEPSQLAPELVPGRHVHLGPLHPHDLDPAVYCDPALDACIVSLDLQGLVRTAQDGRIRAAVSPYLEAALACARFVKASEEELALVCTHAAIRERQLLEQFALEALVITNGSRGGRVLNADGALSFQAAPAPAVVDSTGAGDVFFAAWLARRLHASDSIRDACTHAAVIAARHVAGSWLPRGALETEPPSTRSGVVP